MSIADLAKRAGKFTADNSPGILTALGVTGTVMTAYFTGKATFKAAEILDRESKKEIEKAVREESSHAKGFVEKGGFLEFSTMKKIELTWKFYIPAIGMGITTITCIIAANRIGTRRAAALAAAYTLSEKAITEYKDKVVEKLGEKKEQQIRDEIAQDRVNRNPVGNREVIITGGGEVLCMDSWTNRYFRSDMNTIKRAQNDINAMVFSSGYVSLGEYYDHIGLSRTQDSEELGWTTDKMLELQFTTAMAENTDEPCIVVSFATVPIRDYYRFQ